MKLPQACHRYKTCSVNACPLEKQAFSTVETDLELTCPLSDFDIGKIKERFERIKNKPRIEAEPLPDLNLNSERMRDENDQLYRANPKQARKVHPLVKSECCNYSKNKGTCILLGRKCPQLITASVMCSWCREAIIPLDKELECEIFEHEKSEKVKQKTAFKKCDTCGRNFKPKSSWSRRCPECALKVRRGQLAKSQRKTRAMSTKIKVSGVQPTTVSI